MGYLFLLIERGHFQKVLERCEKVRHPIADVFKLGILNRGLKREQLESMMEREGDEQIQYLERYLGALIIIIGVEPMLGFLGTIVGLIQAFMSWEQLGSNITVSALAAGICSMGLDAVLVGVIPTPGVAYLARTLENAVAGVVIGVMLVVVILSLGSGIKNVVNNMLAQFGSDYIIVFPGKETNPFASLIGSQKFRESDIMDLEKIPGVSFALPMDLAMLNIEYRGEKKVARVQEGAWSGVAGLFESSRGIKLEKGTWPKDGDSGVAVLGYLVANQMFKSKISIGEDIIIKAKRTRVAGIISKIGAQDDDNSIYISPADFRMLTGFKPGAITAFVKVNPSADVNLVALQVKAKLSQQEVVQDFAVLTPETAERLAGNVIRRAYRRAVGVLQSLGCRCKSANSRSGFQLDVVSGFAARKGG